MVKRTTHNVPMHAHRTRVEPKLSVKTRLTIAQSSANRHREIKPVTLAEMPWESTKEEDKCTK